MMEFVLIPQAKVDAINERLPDDLPKIIDGYVYHDGMMTVSVLRGAELIILQVSMLGYRIAPSEDTMHQVVLFCKESYGLTNMLYASELSVDNLAVWRYQ